MSLYGRWQGEYIIRQVLCHCDTYYIIYHSDLNAYNLGKRCRETHDSDRSDASTRTRAMGLNQETPNRLPARTKKSRTNYNIVHSNSSWESGLNMSEFESVRIGGTVVRSRSLHRTANAHATLLLPWEEFKCPTITESLTWGVGCSVAAVAYFSYLRELISQETYSKRRSCTSSEKFESEKVRESDKITDVTRFEKRSIRASMIVERLSIRSLVPSLATVTLSKFNFAWRWWRWNEPELNRTSVLEFGTLL